MSWKFKFLSLVICIPFLFTSSCKNHSTNKIRTQRSSVKSGLPKKICGMKLRDAHNVSFEIKDDMAYFQLTQCVGSFILGNRKSDKPKTCTLQIKGPCVSPENIFSRYGDRDAGRIKKALSAEHTVRVEYTVPEKSYGLISIEPALKVPRDSFSFSIGSVDFTLSGLAFLRREKKAVVIRSLAPGGSINIQNSSCRPGPFRLLLENFSDSLSRIHHSGLAKLKVTKKATLSYLLEGTMPGKSFATIEILQRPVSRPWSFAFGGDVKDELDVFIQLLEQLMLRQNPLFIIEAGDYTRNSLPRELHEYFHRTGWLPIPVYFVKGNHEIRVQGRKHYKRMFGPSYYSFIFDDVLFVILDSTDYAAKGTEAGFRIGKKQFNWLEGVLSSHKDVKYSFMAVHTPPSPLHGPSLRHTYPSNMMPSEAKKLMELSKKYSVSYVLSGHAHLYARKKIGKTVYLTSGAGGAKLYTYNKVKGFEMDTRKHLMVFEINDSDIREHRVFLPRKVDQ